MSFSTGQFEYAERRPDNQQHSEKQRDYDAKIQFE
jgi:hypothetical protein